MSRSQDKYLRVGVVGCGNMGSNHLRIYDTLKRADLVGLYDPRREVAEALARQYRCKVFGSLEEMAAEVDAVSVTAPSNLHAEIGCFFLGRGIHCLVEKPLATTEEECLALIAAADKSGAVLGVGHVERFNPAVQQLKELLAAGRKVSAVSVRRLSHAGGRIKDIDVILDLMVHDIDIVNFLFGDVGSVASALGVSPLSQGPCDHAVALLSFPGGGIASLESSRVTENKIRELTLNSDIGFVKLNYLSQELVIYRSGTLTPLPGKDNPSYAVDLVSENIVVRRGEPLVNELGNFVAASLGNGSIGVTGTDALNALRTVWDIRERMVMS